MADFKREKEVKQLISFLGNGKVNIVAGLRRSGKTYLLDTVFKNKITEEGSAFKEDDIGILYLDSKDKDIRTEQQLDIVLNDFAKAGKKIIIIDEVQLAVGFVFSLKAFVEQHKEITVFVTGSNSYILSSDIIRMFQDDCESIVLNPLTYKEIVEEIPDYSFDSYITYGGLPIVVKQESEKKAHELDSIYKEIFEKDIEDRMNEDKYVYLSSNHVREIIHLIASSASPVSPSAITKRILSGLSRSGADELKVSKEVNDLFILLENVFLLKQMRVDDYNNRTPLENLGLNKKYYFSDNGLRYINCLDLAKSIGLCLENAVFVELDMRGIKPTGKISIGDKNVITGEIDFDYRVNEKEHLIQVAHTINQANYSREIGNLQDASSKTHKSIIYLYNMTGKTETGIEYLPSSTFFLK